jgi:hypothetical protein
MNTFKEDAFVQVRTSPGQCFSFGGKYNPVVRTAESILCSSLDAKIEFELSMPKQIQTHMCLGLQPQKKVNSHQEVIVFDGTYKHTSRTNLS